MITGHLQKKQQQKNQKKTKLNIQHTSYDMHQSTLHLHHSIQKHSHRAEVRYRA